MNRLDLLPDNQLVTRARNLLTVSNELKGAPQILGSDSVLTSVVRSGAAYDIQVNTIDYNSKVIEVTYTPAASILTGTGIVWDFDYTDIYGDFNFVGVTVEALEPVGGIQKWRLYLNGNDSFPSIWGRYTFYFFTIGSGTFTTALV